MSASLIHNRYFNSTVHSNLSGTVGGESKENEYTIVVTKPKDSKFVRSVGTRSKSFQASFKKSQDFNLIRVLCKYVDSGNTKDAKCIFEKLNHSDAYVWNVIIRGFTDNGLFQEAVGFYHRMDSEGVQADKFTYPALIKACGGLSFLNEGKKIHGRLFKLGLDSDVFVCNSVISMYAKLGCAEYAVKVFEEMPEKDLVSWNSMISGYVSLGDALRSLDFFSDMLMFGLKPDRFSIISALNACSIECFLQNGKELHCQALKLGLESDVMVQTSLLDMYNRCGRLDYAERLFHKISLKNTAVWNTMVGVYVLNGLAHQSFACLRKMHDTNYSNPDAITLINVLPLFAKGSLLEGKSIHGYAIRKGIVPHIVLETSLINFYGACTKLKFAEFIFGKMAEKSFITWNTMISAYVRNGLNREALVMFQELLCKTLKPDAVTIASILPAYSEVASLREAKQIHGYIIKSGLHSNTYVLNSASYMYAKCGKLETTKEIFDRILSKDVSSWNTIIMAYAIHGFGRTSIELYSEMIEKGMKPNETTFVSLLTSCSISGMVYEGWNFFNSMKRDYDIDPGIEHYGCILDLLGRVGNLKEAKDFVEKIPLVPTARIWGSLLTASKNHRNIELAEFVARHILSLGHDNTGCYILLSNLYAEAGRWEDVKRMKSLMKLKGLEKTVGRCFVESKCDIHRFIDDDRSHVETNMIYNVLSILLRMTKEAKGFVNISKFRPPDLKNKRANSQENHSVRLAICYGLISTKIGHPVFVRKNTRMCKDCHSAAKKISQVTKREIIVGDLKVIHHFIAGHCSCGDYW